MRKLLIYIIFVLIIAQLYANEAKFYSVNNLYGISMRETTTICEDDNGFVWTVSKTGVLRVSDRDYKIYQLPYKTADVVNIRLAYGNSHLYVYTSNGQLFVYDNVFDKFNFVCDFRNVLKNIYFGVNFIQVQRDGTLWISSTLGLFRLKNGSLAYVKIWRRTRPLHIINYGDHKLFISTRRYIGIFDANSLKMRRIVEKKDGELNITKLYYDKNSNFLWIGTLSDGLFFYDLNKSTFQKVKTLKLPKQPILAIERNKKTSLLIGIDGQGVWEISNKGESVINVYNENLDNPMSLFGDGVYDIHKDRSERIWVSTYTGGLSFFDQKSQAINLIAHKLNTTNSLFNNYVNRVVQDKNGNLWFATNNGISKWNMSSNKWLNFYQNKNGQAKVFLSLAEDNSGNIWAGTYASGVYVLDGTSGRELMHFSDGWNGVNFSANYIFSIFKDSQGDVWLGGVRGEVICYQSEKKTFRVYTNLPVKSFAELSPGKILLGCTHGLKLLDKETGLNDFLLQSYIVHDIFVQGSDIWLATSGDGLLKYNYTTKALKKITVDEGIPSNYINSIIKADGYFWLGAETGLCRFDPINGKVVTYSSVLPFSTFSFNGAAKYQLKNGDLIFGSNNGAIIFNPKKIRESKQYGRIFLNDLKLSGRSIRENTELMGKVPLNEKESVRLKYNQNTIELGMLAVGISSSDYKYSWKMDGLDKEWRIPARRKTIIYTNLPSGDYKLRIKMYDSSLTNVIDERVLKIHIVPAFWESWWFRLLLLSLAFSLVYFLLKIYTSRLQQKHDEDKIRFFTSTAHDIRTSLTLIKAPIEELSKESELSEAGQYHLNLATEQARRLSFVSTQLLDFQKADIGKGQLSLVMVDIVGLVRQRKSMFETAARKKNIEIQFTTNKDWFASAIDELKIEKVVDNLISNAVKYSHSNGIIEINLNCNEESWTLEVKDYGIGISKKDQKKLFREFYRGENAVNSKIVGSGIGLLLVKNYVSMHNGEVSLCSDENAETIFRITIPYKQVDEVSVKESEDPDLPHLSVEDNNNLLTIDTEDFGLKKPLLLIVEDNNDLQNFLKNAFRKDYKVITANDGAQGWSIIQKKMPDLVISDVVMPNMDGFELCKLIKSTFDTAHIPVVLLTAMSENTDQLEGLKLGADDYITKPFEMTLLSERLNTIVRNRNIVKERALKMIKQTDNDQPLLMNSLNDQFVKKALDVVRENIANSGFNKDEFASAMNASPSLLYKKIKALTGQSPVDFIKIIRLDNSLELLQTRKYSVTEVSELCGFSSVGYFSTVFKKHFGKLPTDILE